MQQKNQVLALCVLLALTSTSSFGQPSVIPAPVQMQVTSGAYAITAATSIRIPAGDKAAAKVAAHLRSSMTKATGFPLATVESGQGGIEFQVNAKADPKLGKEGYTLVSSNSGVLITANQAEGLFYGAQTLIQLLPASIEGNDLASDTQWTVPGVNITDYPRFGWRGIMLDVSRHFFTKEYVKSYIDRMARYKFNRLHWHLTDDNGWRVEIKSLPKLTEVGAWRVPRTGTFGSNKDPQPGEAATDGGFYSQDEIREIVQYAKDRYVEILPEIDVPGHSMAAIAAYPELSITKDPSTKVNPGTEFSTWHGNGKFTMHVDNTLNPVDENVYVFLDKVFTEVAALFPFEYIHMGGDECYKGYWEKDPGAQAFMKKNKIKDGVELQAHFNRRVNKIINSKKKTLIGWDEILEGGIAENAAVMSWRGVKGGIEATHLKHKVVMSPAPIWYLDMMQGDVAVEAPVYSTSRLKDVYAFDILAPGIDSAYVLGGQGNLWTEQTAVAPQVDYMTYPRAFAIAEGLWSPKQKKQWDSFSQRVEQHFERLAEAGVNYSPSVYDPIIKVTKDAAGSLVIELATELKGLDLYYTIDNATPNQYFPKYQAPIVLTEDVDIFRVISYRNGKAIGRLISLDREDLVKRAGRR